MGVGAAQKVTAGPRVLQANLARGFRGGERQTLLLAEALTDLGVDSRLLLARGSGIPRHLKKPLRHTVTRRNLPTNTVRDCALVHAQEAKAATWAWWNHLRTGTPYLITRHMPFAPGRGFVTRAAYQNAAAVICISQSVRRAFAPDAPLNFSIIPNMTTPMHADPAAVAELREQFRGRFVAGHIGALSCEKGQEFLIKAARILRHSCPRLKLLLIGDGPDEARMREMARGLSTVEFTGFRDNIADYLALLDLFVFPSRFEGLGSALLDAMAAGLPIVAGAVAGVRDVIRDGETGLLTADADAQELAAAIKRIYDDRNLAAALARNAKKESAAYAPGLIARRHLDLYRRVLAGQE